MIIYGPFSDPVLKLPRDNEFLVFATVVCVFISWCMPHPNVVAIYWTDWVPPTREYFAIEMEYFPSSRLAELLDSSAGGFVKSYAKLLGLFEQVLAGVTYLHGIEMCHGDIKPHNILVSGDTAKITDFGSSVWPEDMYARTRENGGTILYSAPELASTLRRGRSMQDLFLGDICSLGVMLYHIVTGDLALMLSVSLSSKFSVIPYYLLIRKSPSQAAVIGSLSRIPKS